MSRRVLALFSGGLDSLLAVFLMKRLGFEVIPIFFQTPFFPAKKALKVAKANELEIEVIDFTDEHLKMLMAPVYGYGKHFNPCIDCHGLMFRTLKSYLQSMSADFIVSGEVLNQRPMSQRYDSLNAVKKLSTIGDLIVRPLSQKRLPDTLPIREGWVNKDDMLDIVGRSRTIQLQLAMELNLKDIENSGGGCLLTDKGYTTRLKELIDHDMLDLQNIKFLQSGRHFRIDAQTKLIINRHIHELEHLHSVIDAEIILKCLHIPGPIGILCSTHSEVIKKEELVSIAASILLRYTPRATDVEPVSYGKQFQLVNTISANRYDDAQIDIHRIN
jgi:tRNA U34 2-thiouridine synthase MnmA/TrmU